MPLIKSVSGFRGTIGGKPGDNLTPLDIIESTAAFGQILIKSRGTRRVVIGRDGRISGEVVSSLVANTLMMQGFDIIDLGITSTPTVEIAVVQEKADGGIIITASHNPMHWNALKLLNSEGEFISADKGRELLEISSKRDYRFCEAKHIGTYRRDQNYVDKHISMICDLPLINQARIRDFGFKVVVDCINSSGAIVIPPLLEELGVEYILINSDLTGTFAHNPEPLAEHLTDLKNAVVKEGADIGISVDPDVDRLALVCENGSYFGEELTLVAAAEAVLSQRKGNTVSNLSSSKALSDLTQIFGGQYFNSAVGEVHVVKKMKQVNAVIGGEGNGGVILPDLHFGRDALVGIALILDLISRKSIQLSELKRSYPQYVMIKRKMELKSFDQADIMISQLKNEFKEERLNEIDGLKIEFEAGWVHLRKSNTEPVMRIYAEARNNIEAEKIIQRVQEKFI